MPLGFIIVLWILPEPSLLWWLQSSKHINYFVLIFLAIPHCLWDLGSPTRDLTWPPAVEGWNPNLWTARKLPKLCNGVGSLLQLKEYEFEQIPGDGEGQGSLLLCSPWGHKRVRCNLALNKEEASSNIQFHLLVFFATEYFKCSIFSLS